MLTGTHGSIVIAPALDCDNELEVQAMGHMDDWLTEAMAIKVIKHLATVFGLLRILEATELYEQREKV